MSTNAYPGPRPDRATAQRKREAALARLTRVRAIMIAGAGALTAVVAGVVSSASGHTLGATHAVRVRRRSRLARRGRSGPAVTLPPLASARQLGLRRPGASPQSVPPQAPPPRRRRRQAQPVAPQAAAPQAVAPQPCAAAGRTGGLRRLLTASTSFPALGSTAVVMTGDGEHLTAPRRPSSVWWPSSISPARGFARTPSCRRSTGPADAPGGLGAAARGGPRRRARRAADRR